MTRSLAVRLVLAALLLAACADSGQDQPDSAQQGTSATTSAGSGETTSPAPSARPSSSGGAGLELVTRASDFGRMLFDRSGQAIYLFDKEPDKRPRCYGDCAEAWPPVLTNRPPKAGDGARPSLLGTTSRRDGTIQVTYAGHPLYYYAHEGKNQVLCHNVEEFGGLWLVVTPAGRPAA